MTLVLLAWHREWRAKSRVNIIGEIARLSRLGECWFNTFRTLHFLTLLRAHYERTILY